MKVLAVSSYGVLAGAELSLAEFVAHRPAGVDVAALLVEDGPLRAHLEGIGIAAEGCDGFDGPPGHCCARHHLMTASRHRSCADSSRRRSRPTRNRRSRRRPHSSHSIDHLHHPRASRPGCPR